MESTRKLQCPALSEGETPTFRIQPVGPTAGEPAFISAADFSTSSQVLDRVSKEPSPNRPEFRQTPMSASYEPENKRG
jgi:hypothetical protein